MLGCVRMGGREERRHVTPCTLAACLLCNTEETKEEKRLHVTEV